MNHLAIDSKTHRYFPDFTKIPHVLCLFDHPLFDSLFAFKDNPYSLFTCVDRSHLDFFDKLDYHRAFFMPHATDQSLIESPASDRPYNVVFLSSWIDSDAIWNKWKKQYPHIHFAKRWTMQGF